MKIITPLPDSSLPDTKDTDRAASPSQEDAPETIQILNSFEANIQANPINTQNTNFEIEKSSNTTSDSSVYIWVVIIAVLLLLIGAFELIQTLSMSTISPSGEQNTAAQFSKYLGLIFSGAYIFCALGLLLRNDTARSVTVILIILNMLTSIGTLIFVVFSPLPLISFIIQFTLVLFLNSQKVKNIF